MSRSPWVLEKELSETTLQDVGPFERILTVEVPESDLDAAKNRAARKISREVNIKGFRPGKAPRKVVEATVGADRVRAEAIDDVLPEVVGNALEQAEIEPAVAPAVEAIRDVDAGVEVDVRVTLWPTLDRVPEYRGREIEIEGPELGEDQVQEQIDRLREQFAELETVSRPSQEGDFVSINLSTTKGGEPVPEVSATDLLYEVGSNSLIEGLDAHVTGRSTGDIGQFDTVLSERFGELAGTQVSIQVLIKEVKEKRLPDVTDEWVSDHTEFDTLDELRQELVGRMEGARRDAMRNVFQAKLLETLLGEMELVVPEGLIDAEMEEIFHRFTHQLSDSGIELGDYLQLTGMTQEAFIEDLRNQATVSVKTDILLDAVAEAEGLAVDDAELAALYASLANQTDGTEAGELAERLKGSVQEKRIVGDILRRKALEAVVRGAVAVDESGEPVDLGLDEPEGSDRLEGSDRPQDIDQSPEDGRNGDTETQADAIAAATEHPDAQSESNDRPDHDAPDDDATGSGALAGSGEEE